MPDQSLRFATLAVHGGDPHPRLEGAVTPPIWQTSTFESSGQEGSYDEIRYARLSNTPTHTALHARLAALEGAESAVVTASGMAAISATLLSWLRNGDHLIVHRALYGGTHALVHRDLPLWGIEVSAVDTSDRRAVENAMRPNTRVIYTEAVVNPTLEVPDHDAIIEIARGAGIVSVIDATFASPYLFRPIARGFDVVVHSATKYLNGHSDVIAGVVASTRQNIERVTGRLNHLGGSLDPLAGFLLARGIRTLHLRMQRQCENALALARALEKIEGVSRVHYPWLESHPTHANARRYLSAGGGVLSFELSGGVAHADRMIPRLGVAIHAPSLGGVETLVSRPAAMSHLSLTAAERELAGVSEGLVRVAVGVEHVDDLISDFTQAISA